MAISISSFNCLSELILDGSLDLETSTIKIALIKSLYTFDATDVNFTTEIQSEEIDTGNGYTTGGETITTPAVTIAAGVATFDADDVTWAVLTATFRAAVIYADGTFNTYTDPPIAYILFNTALADITVTAFDFSTIWHASGILTVSVV